MQVIRLLGHVSVLHALVTSKDILCRIFASHDQHNFGWGSSSEEWTSRRANLYKWLVYGCIVPPHTASPVMRFLLISAIDTLAISLFFYLLVKFRYRQRRKGVTYPPRPPSWPIIGNFLDMPKDEPWIAYTEMSKKYGRRNILCTTGSPQLNCASQGDIVYLRAFSNVIVVLSSFSAIKDLLEKRGEYYSDRPSMPTLEMYVL